MNKKRNLFARFLGCGVMIALAGAMAFTCEIKPVKGVVVLYNDVDPDAYPYNELWIVGAELWEKNVSTGDRMVRKYGGGELPGLNSSWTLSADGLTETYNRFYLEYGEAVAFGDLDLAERYYLKVNDYDYDWRLVTTYNTGSVRPDYPTSDTLYYALTRNASYELVISWPDAPTYRLSYPAVAPVAAVITDKTAVVDEQINTGRKAPTRKVNAPKPEKLEGAQR